LLNCNQNKILPIIELLGRNKHIDLVSNIFNWAKDHSEELYVEMKEGIILLGRKLPKNDFLLDDILFFSFSSLYLCYVIIKLLISL